MSPPGRTKRRPHEAMRVIPVGQSSRAHVAVVQVVRRIAVTLIDADFQPRDACRNGNLPVHRRFGRHFWHVADKFSRTGHILDIPEDNPDIGVQRADDANRTRRVAVIRQIAAVSRDAIMSRCSRIRPIIIFKPPLTAVILSSFFSLCQPTAYIKRVITTTSRNITS